MTPSFALSKITIKPSHRLLLTDISKEQSKESKSNRLKTRKKSTYTDIKRLTLDNAFLFIFYCWNHYALVTIILQPAVAVAAKNRIK
jgi:hypothetical protein